MLQNSTRMPQNPVALRDPSVPQGVPQGVPRGVPQVVPQGGPSGDPARCPKVRPRWLADAIPSRRVHKLARCVHLRAFLCLKKYSASLEKH